MCPAYGRSGHSVQIELPPVPFFGWLNIAGVEGKSNNTLGVWSLFPDPSGTELHQSDLRTEAEPSCSHLFIAVIRNMEVISVWRLHVKKASGFFFKLKKLITRRDEKDNLGMFYWTAREQVEGP